MAIDIIAGTEAAYTVPKWPQGELPFISCKCTTYGRTDLLVESLYSFLIQDYPKDKCELVIVNDYLGFFRDSNSQLFEKYHLYYPVQAPP